MSLVGDRCWGLRATVKARVEQMPAEDSTLGTLSSVGHAHRQQRQTRVSASINLGRFNPLLLD